MSEDERLVRHCLRPADAGADEALDRLIAAAEARGFARAREMAAGLAERCRGERETLAKNEWAHVRPATAQASLEGKWSEAERIRDAIRAMKDEA